MSRTLDKELAYLVAVGAVLSGSVVDDTACTGYAMPEVVAFGLIVDYYGVGKGFSSTGSMISIILF